MKRNYVKITSNTRKNPVIISSDELLEIEVRTLVNGESIKTADIWVNDGMLEVREYRIPSMIGDVKLLEDLQHTDYSLVQDSDELQAVVDSVSPEIVRYEFGDPQAIRGAVVMVEDGDYKEIWATDHYPYYDLAAHYVRIK